MKKIISLLLISVAMSCTSKHSIPQIKASQDSIQKRKTDSLMALGNRPDSEQDEPTFKKVLTEELASYNKIQNTDTLIFDGKDSMRVNCKFYCLHDSALVVPKNYLWGGDKSKDFITHNFAAKIILTKNRDTVLNKIFVKKDFTPALYKDLQKHATFVDFNFEGYNTKLKDKFLFGCSISIPLTDLGVPAYLAIDKSGKYEVLNQYAINN
jgi:hypothetical protein